MNYNKDNFVRLIEKRGQMLINKHLSKKWKFRLEYSPDLYSVQFKAVQKRDTFKVTVIYGYCDSDQKEIVINKYAVEKYRSPRFWDNTILHEIAHGIVDKRLTWLWDSHGHNNVWRRAAVKLGSTPVSGICRWEKDYLSSVDCRALR